VSIIVEPKKSFDLEVLITTVKHMRVEAHSLSDAKDLALIESRKHFGEDFRRVDIVEASED